MDLTALPDLLRSLIGPDAPEIAWWQMSVRAVIIFFYGILLVRLAGKRTFGKYSAFDIVIAIVVGSNMSRTLTGNAPFWETLAATTILALIHFVLGRLALRWRWLGRIV